MIVLDASTVVEMLRGDALASTIRRQIVATGDLLIAPHLIDLEVTNALRNLQAGRRIDIYHSEQYLTALVALPIERYCHLPLLPRIWELRHNFTAYDAAYIALAEATNALLFTTDAKLRTGHRARVRLFEPPVN